MIDKAVIISFDWPTLQDIKKLEPRLKTGALASGAYFRQNPWANKNAAAVKEAGADYFGVESSYLTPDLMAELRKLGIGAGAWTVNAEGDMKRLAGLGPDFLTTDRPDVLRRVLGR
jgi:glycerophosphoryl diester phosphodiesterase